MEWISVEDKLPEKGKTVLCKVEIWRNLLLHHIEEIESEYLGWYGCIGKPMFDIETYDEAFADVTHWKPTR